MLLQSLSLLKRIGLPKNYFILTCLHVFYYSGYIYIGRKKITATGSHSNLTDLTWFSHYKLKLCSQTMFKPTEVYFEILWRSQSFKATKYARIWGESV